MLWTNSENLKAFNSNFTISGIFPSRRVVILHSSQTQWYSDSGAHSVYIFSRLPSFLILRLEIDAQRKQDLNAKDRFQYYFHHHLIWKQINKLLSYLDIHYIQDVNIMMCLCRCDIGSETILTQHHKLNMMKCFWL